MATWVHLRCVDKDEAQKIIEAVHEGVYGTYMNRTVLVKKIARQGYFWLAMKINCIRFVKRYHNCQTYDDVSHFSSMKL